MQLLTWSQENSVGVAELDNQHQKMFSIINNLSDLMSKSKVQGEIDSVLDELIKYADYHFQTEENYFEKYNYENKQEHILLHNEYKEKIPQLIIMSKTEGGMIASFAILDFLEDWWIKHINFEDKKYMEALKIKI